MKYFKEGNEIYRLSVFPVEEAESPRDYDGNIGHMYIWWNRYLLGDENPYESPYDMLAELIETKVPEDKLLEYAKSDNSNLLIEFNEREKAWFLFDKKTDYYLADEPEEKDLVPYIAEALDFKSSIEVLGYADIVMLPLYAYEHGGITISASYGYPYSDRWDGGQCGYIWTDKETTKEWVGGYEEDGIFFELTEQNWKTCAIQNMLDEVKTYDQYLQGEVYGYELEKLVDGEWDYVDSCSGFYSDKWGDELYRELAGEVTGEKLYNTQAEAAA